MLSQFSTSFLRAACLSVCLLSAAHAETTISVHLDNDGMLGTDKDYSNGLFFDVQTKLKSAPLVWLEKENSDYYLGVSLSQKIWTPTDIRQLEPAPNERPYAGLSYLTTRLAIRSPKEHQNIELMLGTLGEKSLASMSQRWVHDLIGSPRPAGWQYQVEEPLVWGANYQQHNALYDSSMDSSGFETTWINRVQLGNFQPEIASGVLWRYGSNLASTFGSTTISYAQPNQTLYAPKDQAGYFYFTGIEARYRFQDLTLSGATPPEVYPVSIQHWQSTAQIGAVGYYHGLGIGFTVVAKSPDYLEDQHNLHAAASLSLFWML
ncbi:lipid A deacylase LpxR family protein [Vibrio tapetis subsp. quintayensis]|uniref:lipid A deacylase LpxR family protein n=1 Tax=Vibrio tapetis TaxID=52443 RepID=UPI0025B2B0FC|nr:lipid A deacylase LpxR family protein [Vibrio tapetis]MDN3679782.1 lipid A deacylase LpxR family protein [Vibrio tapetis subsp. quintayensis]